MRKMALAYFLAYDLIMKMQDFSYFNQALLASDLVWTLWALLRQSKAQCASAFRAFHKSTLLDKHWIILAKSVPNIAKRWYLD